MANVKNNSATQETRRRLLAAAGAVFADRGFHGATIKEITDRAGASLASVNYHFTDKAELYAAVLRRLADDSAGLVPPADLLASAAGPAERLRRFVRHFCAAMLGRQREPWEQVLMARELAEPSAALDPLVDHVMRPLGDALSAVVADLLDVPASHPAVGLASASVVGQCVYYLKHRCLIGRHVHRQLDAIPGVEQMAAHVTAFSLAGIRDQRRRLATTGAANGRARHRTNGT